MTARHGRNGFTLSQLLVLLAILALLLGFLLSAVQRVRMAASRAASQNNMKQILLGVISYADAQNGKLPAGCDKNEFSAFAYALPYIEQNVLFKQIDFTKGAGDKANDTVRKSAIKTFLNPNDPLMSVNEFAATNYQFNVLAFPHLKELRYPASITDGTSNTIFLAETLKGDGNKKAVDVRRQHVVLSEKDAAQFKDDKRAEMGVDDWKQSKNIAGDRGASWMDGRYLQSPSGPGRLPNDMRPDVGIDVKGTIRDGLSGPRSLEKSVIVGMGDGSVRTVQDRISAATWNAALTPASDDMLGNDW